MPVRRVREYWVRYDVTAVLARVCRYGTLAAGLLLTAQSSLQTATADSDTRTLSFRHAHTGEEITVTFKRNGRYDQAALKQLNWFMRDWRKDQQVEMNPQLFDLVWETNRAVGGTQPIEVICGYRSPSTNAMLRARSNGVAENSNHVRGEALDFFIPGVPLEKIREVGLRMQRGGVGFYPSSGSPFVHLDTGSIRHWPRMTYDQLARVFPDGRTVHLPSNGQPLPGYELALADVERQGRSPSALTLLAARNSGASDGHESISQPAPRNLIADLFGFNTKDKVEPVTAPPQPTVASLTAGKPAAGVPLPKHRPTHAIEVATYVPMPAARPSAADAIAVAIGEPIVTASAAPVLAYASAQPQVPAAAAATATVKPMGTRIPKVVRTASATQPAAPDTALIATAAPTEQRTLGDNPWLRAMVLAPNTTMSLTTTAIGRYDTVQFAEFLKKPTSSVVMSFAAEPYADLTADRFTGSAVVFVATATFSTRTAQLQR